MNKYLIIYAVVITILASIFGFLAFRPLPEVNFDQELVDKEKNKLRKENESLIKQIWLIKDAREVYLSKIDSLENLKPKKEIVYVEKIKLIDNASISGKDSILRANLGLKR